MLNQTCRFCLVQFYEFEVSGFFEFVLGSISEEVVAGFFSGLLIPIG